MTKKKSSTTTSPRVDRRSARRQREQRRQRQRTIAFGIIGVGIVLLAFLLWWASRPPTVEMANLHKDQPPGADGMAWGGPEDAAVVIQEYSDFGCGHCGNFARNTGPTLIDLYADNPNVRFEYKPFYLSPTTMNAAVGAVCAAEQNLFWPYHDTLFANQSSGPAVFEKPFLEDIAVAIGADAKAFNKCIDGGAARRTVNDIRSEGENLGVNATPTFFIDGQLLSGNRPLDEFTEAIDQALAEAGVSGS
jgi:protein-disulfide isomerase